MATIIFDFDGTIADSFDYVADFLIGEAGYEVSAKEREGLRNLSMVAMARSLGVSWWRLPLVFIKGRKQMRHAIHRLAPFEGMPELIKKLNAEGHEIFLLSSNSVRNIRLFLNRHKMNKYFLEIYGGVGMFGKAPALRRLLKEHKLELNSAVYVGDELRDVEAAQSIDMKVVAVKWGFAQIKTLEDRKPTALVGTPAELLSQLEEI